MAHASTLSRGPINCQMMRYARPAKTPKRYPRRASSRCRLLVPGTPARAIATVEFSSSSAKG
eukprot:5547234-Alexandrium_andersonii.AAC.1